MLRREDGIFLRIHLKGEDIRDFYRDIFEYSTYINVCMLPAGVFLLLYSML